MLTKLSRSKRNQMIAKRINIDRECFISTHGWTYMLLHFEKMDLAIFTTNTLYKHIFTAHMPSYEYLFHLLSIYYFLLEVNLLKKDMIKAISQIKKKKVIQYFFRSHFSIVFRALHEFVTSVYNPRNTSLWALSRTTSLAKKEHSCHNQPHI